MNIVCDSSSIITLAENCLVYLFGDFARKGVKFYLPVGVRKEVIDTPMTTRKFKFEALRVSEAIDKGWLVLAPQRLSDEVHLGANRFMTAANALFRIKNRPVPIIQYGEAEAVALARAIGAETILVDEKTTRLLIESPEVIKASMERRVGSDVSMDRGALKVLQNLLKGFHVIRSAELVVVAHERGLLDRFFCDIHINDQGRKHELLKGVLYSLKESGCAITEDELNEYFQSEG